MDTSSASQSSLGKQIIRFCTRHNVWQMTPFVLFASFVGVTYTLPEMKHLSKSLEIQTITLCISIAFCLLLSISLTSYFAVKRYPLVLCLGLTMVGAVIFLSGILITSLLAANGVNTNFLNFFSQPYDVRLYLIAPFISVLLLITAIIHRLHLKSDINFSANKLIKIYVFCWILSYGILLIISKISNNVTAFSLVQLYALAALIISAITFVILPKTRSFHLEKLEYWFFYYLIANLSIYLTPTSVETNFSKLASPEVEIVRIGTSLVILGGLIYNALWIVAQETKIRRKLWRKNRISELLFQGTLVIANADEFEPAAQQCLPLMKATDKWVAGHLIILGDDRSAPVNHWDLLKHHNDSDFVQISNKLGAQFGVGLIGQTWEDQTVKIIEDLSKVSDDNYVRKPQALELGYQSCVAIPITADNELVAVYEFYQDSTGHPSEASMTVLNALSQQLGQLHESSFKRNVLVQQEANLLEIFNQFPSAIAAFDENDELTLFNNEFAKFARFLSTEAVQSLDFTDFFTRMAYSGKITGLDGNEQLWIEKRIQRHQAGFSNRVCRLANGKFFRTDEIRTQENSSICIWTDVTDQKSSELNAFNTLEVLETTLSAFPGGICIFNKDLRVSINNQKFLDLLDLLPGDIQQNMSLGCFLDLFREKQYIYAEFLAEMAEMTVQVSKEKRTYKNSNLLFAEKVFFMQAAPLTDNGFAISLFDVSEVQDYQNRLREERDRSEKSAQKANELAEVAKIANNAKTGFLSLVSHEIRTPLNGILTAVDLLRSEELNDSQSRHLKIIKNATTNLNRLLHELLDVTNIEKQQMDLQFSTIRLKDFIDRIQDNWDFQIQSKELQFKIQLSDDLPEIINIDPLRVEQILDNLIGNALKFTSSGSISFAVSRGHSKIPEMENNLLRFEIRDTGKGLPEGNHKKLFKRFSQEDSTSTRSYGGIGLGLSISHDLVSLMDGTIDVESKFGEGSLFWFEINVTAQPHRGQSDNTQPFPILDQDLWEYDGEKLSILAAEDHPVNQIVLEELLENWGHQVDFVDNGEKAVAAVASCKYDLVLMDIQMPEMDGYMATREIRKFPGQISDIPIIALTANVMMGERKKCLDAGMNDYLTKPIQKWEIKDTLLTYSKRKSMSESWRSERLPQKTEELEPKPIEPLLMDDAIVTDLISTFSTETVENLAVKMFEQYETSHINLVQHQTNRDFQGISNEAHALKSIFGQFGLLQAAQLAAQLETACKAGQLEEVIEQTTSMMTCCDNSLLALKVKLAQHNAPS
jgi:signal transduction histidine kinase/DNA-binding NarL/FixJ family response regulator/HPt (histidine-containing phosphotransfer) domain-containing protein